MNREKMIGLSTHPWRTPTGQQQQQQQQQQQKTNKQKNKNKKQKKTWVGRGGGGKKTQDSKESYIDFIEANHFPWTSSCNRLSWCTESKAFLKSTKATYN